MKLVFATNFKLQSKFYGSAEPTDDFSLTKEKRQIVVYSYSTRYVSFLFAWTKATDVLTFASTKAAEAFHALILVLFSFPLVQAWTINEGKVVYNFHTAFSIYTIHLNFIGSHDNQSSFYTIDLKNQVTSAYI